MAVNPVTARYTYQHRRAQSDPLRSTGILAVIRFAATTTAIGLPYSDPMGYASPSEQARRLLELLCALPNEENKLSLACRREWKCLPMDGRCTSLPWFQ